MKGRCEARVERRRMQPQEGCLVLPGLLSSRRVESLFKTESWSGYIVERIAADGRRLEVPSTLTIHKLELACGRLAARHMGATSPQEGLQPQDC